MRLDTHRYRVLIRTKSDEQFLKQGGTWDQAAGDRVIRFVESYIKLPDGRPFVLLPWQREFIHSIYSWRRPDGRRRVKVALLTMGRKQGKTLICAALTAYHLVADRELSPSCVSCACDREQAAQVYDTFKFSIDNNRQLAKALHYVDTKKLVTYPKRNGRYRSLSSDAAGAFGHGHSFVIHDELAFHKRDDLYTALQNSTDSRPDGLQVIISTAGWNRNGAFYRLVQYARKVLSGEVIDTTFMPWVYEVPSGADLDDPRNWPLANPSLGVSQSVEDFGNQWQRAKHDSSSKLSFTRLKFNQWTESENQWIDPQLWEQCRGPIPNLDRRPCVLGIDVGASRDLTAVSAVFPAADRKLYVKSWGFVPEGALRTRDGTNHLIYEACRADGSLTITPGTATDEQQLCRFIDQLRERYDVRACVFDKWQSLTVANHMSRQRVDVMNFPQTHAYFNAPSIELERAVNDRRLVHDGNALLRWQVGHTYLDRDAKGYVKPATSRPENKKDNLIGLLMALSQTLQMGDRLERPRSRYDTDGLAVI